MTGFVQLMARIAGCLATLLAVPTASACFDLRPVAQILVDAVELAPDAPGSILVRFRALDAEGAPVRDLRPVDVSLKLDEREVADTARSELLATELHPLSTVLAIDTSRTMLGRPIEEVRKVALSLAEDLGPRDRLAVVTFSDRVTVLADFRTPRGELHARLRALEVDEQAMTTVLWEGIASAIELLRSSGAGGPVVVFSDGRDNGSPVGLSELIASSKARPDRAQVSILPVAYTGRGTRGRADLQALAAATGGSLRDLDRVGPEPPILSPLRAGYTLRFAADLDGAPHHVQIAVETARGALVSHFPQLVRVAEAVAARRPVDIRSWGLALSLLAAGFLAGRQRTRWTLGLRRLRHRFAR